RGTFDRAAAQAVAGVRATILVALVDKSLLRQAEVGRYNLHELLRQFAAERLDASGEAGGRRVADGAHHLALGEGAGAGRAGGGAGRGAGGAGDGARYPARGAGLLPGGERDET